MPLPLEVPQIVGLPFPNLVNPDLSSVNINSPAVLELATQPGVNQEASSISLHNPAVSDLAQQAVHKQENLAGSSSEGKDIKWRGVAMGEGKDIKFRGMFPAMLDLAQQGVSRQEPTPSVPSSEGKDIKWRGMYRGTPKVPYTGYRTVRDILRERRQQQGKSHREKLLSEGTPKQPPAKVKQLLQQSQVVAHVSDASPVTPVKIKDMIEACRLVVNCEVPVRQAAAKCNVPITQLVEQVWKNSKCNSSTGDGSCSSSCTDAQIVLPLNRENSLAQHMTELADRGYRYNAAMVTCLATEMLKYYKVFKGPLLHKCWYSGFLNRWPVLNIMNSTPGLTELVTLVKFNWDSVDLAVTQDALQGSEGGNQESVDGGNKSAAAIMTETALSGILSGQH